MKNLRFLSVLLFTALCMGFTSCSDDVDEDDLIGTWESSWSEGYERYADHPDWNDEWNEAMSGDVITLNDNHTGTDGEDSFTWNLDGDKLTISYGKGSETAKVLKLNSKELVIEYSESSTDEEGPYEYYEKMTFAKR